MFVAGNLAGEETDDAQLIRRLKKRDAEAMGELYDRFKRPLFVVIFRIVGNTSVAEELLQEAFLRIWNSIHAFDEERGNLRTWIMAVARHRALDYQRSPEWRVAQGTSPIQEFALPSVTSDLDRTLLNLDLAQSLQRALRKLPERQRTLLDLAFVDGLTHAELAVRLERPLGTVKTWIRTAVQALRAEMGVIEASRTQA